MNEWMNEWTNEWLDEFEGAVLAVHSFVNYTVKTARTPIYSIIDFTRLQPFLIDFYLNRFIHPFIHSHPIHLT